MEKRLSLLIIALLGAFSSESLAMASEPAIVATSGWTDMPGSRWTDVYTRFPFRMPTGTEAYQTIASRMPTIPWSWRPPMPSFDRESAVAAMNNNPRTAMIAGAALVLAGGYMAWKLMSPAEKAATTTEATTRVDQAIDDTRNDAAIAAALAAEGQPMPQAPTQEAVDAQVAEQLQEEERRRVAAQEAEDAALARALADE